MQETSSWAMEDCQGFISHLDCCARGSESPKKESSSSGFEEKISSWTKDLMNASIEEKELEFLLVCSLISSEP